MERRPKSIMIPLIVAISLSLCPQPVSGQNLLSDPGFDDPTLAEWPAGWVVSGAWAWDPLDMTGPEGSGSGRLDNLATGSPQYTVTAGPCVDGIDDGSRYDAGVWVFYPSGQTAAGEAYLQIVFYQQAGCGSATGNAQSDKVDQQSPGQWRRSEARNIEPPAGTVAFRFVVSLTKLDSDDPLRVHFDGAELMAVLFGDGFESGDTAAWSASLP